MRKVCYFLTMMACVCYITPLFAQHVSKSEADTVASRFVKEYYSSMSKSPAEIYFKETFADDTLSYMYHYAIGNKGFVIVSASKVAPPVLAYSLDQNFKMIPPVRSLFDYYQKLIHHAEAAKLPSTDKVSAQWAHYLADEFKSEATKGSVNKYLLTTTWNQTAGYNTYCPWDTKASIFTGNDRVLNGCVAVACAQIMNYHHYPKSGIGTTCYIPDGYPTQTVVFPDHVYHWDAMCNYIEYYDYFADGIEFHWKYANEIAKLIYHFGVAIHMDYGWSASYANSEKAKQMLVNTFLYDPSISFLFHQYHPSYQEMQQYISILKQQIDKKLPVYIAGSGNDGRHALVLDGYDNEERFHLNFGWGGFCDGFYTVEDFPYGAFNNQTWDFEALINIFPSSSLPDEYCQGRQRQTATRGYVWDGSPTILPYQANPDCSWMIATPEAQCYHFTFDRLDLNPDVDFVTIYKGPSVESGVKAIFTGTTPPSSSIDVCADSVLITFTSKGNGPDINTDYSGFQISYDVTLTSTNRCQVNNLLDWSSELTDGSEDGSDYSPDIDYVWQIKSKFVSGYSFSFPMFDLGYGDYVDIYDITTDTPVFFRRYDIYNPPTDIDTVYFNQMQVHFVSDNWGQGNGFRMIYNALMDNNNLFEGQKLFVYPNPTYDKLYLAFSLPEERLVFLKISDIAGKTVLSESFKGEEGPNQHVVNLSHLSKGMYILLMENGIYKTIQKVLVK